MSEAKSEFEPELPREELADLLLKFNDDEKKLIRENLLTLNLPIDILTGLLDDYSLAVMASKELTNLKQINDADRRTFLEYIVFTLSYLKPSRGTLRSLIDGATAPPEYFSAVIDKVHKLNQTALAKETGAQIIKKLSTEMESYEPQLAGHAVAGILYGSYNFGYQKQKSDLDFEFVASKSEDIDPLLERAGDELGGWLEASMHTETVTLENFRKTIEMLEKGEFSESLDDPSVILMNLSTIIYGTIINLPGAKNEEIRDEINQVRKDTIEKAKTNHLVRSFLLGAAIYTLKKSRVRKEKGEIK